MDIWQRMYEKAKKEYHPEDVSPFVRAHHVVCAIEAENGEIYTGFCIESASGVMALCAERVACLNMYAQSGQTVVKRLIAFRDDPPKENGGMPCGACREFLLQLSDKNKDGKGIIKIKLQLNTKVILTNKKTKPNLDLVFYFVFTLSSLCLNYPLVFSLTIYIMSICCCSFSDLLLFYNFFIIFDYCVIQIQSIS